MRDLLGGQYVGNVQQHSFLMKSSL
jgi:hypothetical protein